MKEVNRTTTTRGFPESYQVVIEHFGEHLEGEILDATRHENFLRPRGYHSSAVPSGDRSFPAFDWKHGALPFPEKSFDTVLSLNALEHVDDLHVAFDDLLRVTRRHLVVALPNCWRISLPYFIRSSSSAPVYGLSAHPYDERHKWFFNTKDIEAFIYERARGTRYPYQVAKVVYYTPAASRLERLVRFLGRLLLSRHYQKLFIVQNVFFCLEPVDK